MADEQELKKDILNTPFSLPIELPAELRLETLKNLLWIDRQSTNEPPCLHVEILRTNRQLRQEGLPLLEDNSVTVHYRCDVRDYTIPPSANILGQPSISALLSRFPINSLIKKWKFEVTWFVDHGEDGFDNWRELAKPWLDAPKDATEDITENAEEGTEEDTEGGAQEDAEEVPVEVFRLVCNPLRMLRSKTFTVVGGSNVPSDLVMASTRDITSNKEVVPLHVLRDALVTQLNSVLRDNGYCWVDQELEELDPWDVSDYWLEDFDGQEIMVAADEMLECENAAEFYDLDEFYTRAREVGRFALHYLAAAMVDLHHGEVQPGAAVLQIGAQKTLRRGWYILVSGLLKFCK
ncbi:hypothetical protein LTR05_000540 [Lithohypha guttulata]|uniref:Uncharacterized protein n=1 Tax=Lithohypha guttulata TaxID=1690604 RepID=A0AAN7T5E5_9EURO|nr:hypothetical protein LTR05_000540 [Lithohypha guttulata]